MGAGAVTIAFEQEPRLQSVFLESPYSSMGNVIEEELVFAGFPTFLKDAALFAGKVSSGDNLVKYEPIDAMKVVGNRSVYITHSLEDVRINSLSRGGDVRCCKEQRRCRWDGGVLV